MKTKFNYDGNEIAYNPIELQDYIAKATYRNSLLFSGNALTAARENLHTLTRLQELTLQQKLREAV